MKKLITALVILLLTANVFAQTTTIYPAGLAIGDNAPDIKEKDQNGNKVKLKDLLKKGNVVLIFYRGQWCPYCNRQLSNMNDSLSMITAKGATVLTITPETPENIKQTVEKTKATF